MFFSREIIYSRVAWSCLGACTGHVCVFMVKAGVGWEEGSWAGPRCGRRALRTAVSVASAQCATNEPSHVELKILPWFGVGNEGSRGTWRWLWEKQFLVGVTY